MPKILWKDLWIEIRHSLGRFLSILCIVALGVAFFAGIKASAPDMKHSADIYFDEYNTQDIQVFSTLGLTQEDVDEIRTIQGVESVQPLFTIDTLTRLGSSELVYKVFSLPKSSDINEVRLVDGRMPTKENECLIEAPSPNNELFGNYEIGDTIELYSGTDDKLSDTLKHTKYKVVGTCYTTRYLSYEKGTSSIGSGKINGFIFIPESNIKPDYYTEIDVTVAGAKDINTYDEEYFDVVDPVRKRIEAIADDQVVARIHTQQKEVDKARKKLDKEMKKANRELEKAEKELNAGKEEIRKNQASLHKAKVELDQGWKEYYKQAQLIDESLPKISEGIRQIEEQEQKVPALQKQLNDLKVKKEELIQQKNELTQNRESLQQAAQMVNFLEKINGTKDELLKEKANIEKDIQQREALIVRKNQIVRLNEINQEIAQLESLRGKEEQIYKQLQQAQTKKNDLIQKASQIIEKDGLKSYLQQLYAVDQQEKELQSQLNAFENLEANLSALQQEKEALLTILQGSGPMDLESVQQSIDAIDAKYYGQDPKKVLAALDFAIEQTNKHQFPQKEIDAIIQQCQGDPRVLLVQLDQGLVQIDTALPQIEDGMAQIENGISQIQAASVQKQQLLSQQQQLLNAYPQLEQAYQELNAGQSEYLSGLRLLEDAKGELEVGQSEIEKNKQKLADEKAKAIREIQKAQDQIDALKGEWVVLDRDSFYSYRDYEACADRMDGIASVFPVFFFLVAALVCMTTMTRMVDEQRNEIGTLKALGYSKSQISMKYMMYAFSASVLGSIIGCAIGMLIFPYIIFTAWNTMYNIESIHFLLQPGLMLMAGACVTGITLLATFFSIYKELIEVPSQLMRPKAGKAGKKILLERIPFLWNRVSFLRKVTIRNIFRYKKRFLMTVIGISGCSALLVSGFGINDSISDIVYQQFEEIYHFDASMTFEDDAIDVEHQLATVEGVEDVFVEQTLPVSIHIDDKDINGTVHIVPDDMLYTFEDFTTLRSMRSKKPIPLNDDGLYINEKMAQKMKVNVGDTVSFKDTNDVEIKGKVAGIYENYVGHHIYVSQNIFDTWSTSAKTTNSYLLKTKKQTPTFEHDLGPKLMNLKGAKSLSFYSALQKNFLDMIGSIKMIVVVLVISAAALAFVVLYNLSNVNISERLREIATIKVLGFTEKEVNQYVNRESLVLAFIGACVGLVVGIGLHHLIMNLAELDDIMFGRTISFPSFVISFILTMIFAIFVNFVMKFKLRKIKMVESLKAVE